MNTNHKTTVLFISLGSNIEPRLDYLRQATLLIEKQIGSIHNCSPIYETPAWGFISTPFYNACIAIKTAYTTKETLVLLQHIEKEIGRQPKTNSDYEARPIDLDILFSSEGLFNYSNLVVPHPLLQLRKFVLVPLNAITPNYKHPLLHQTINQLLNNCQDSSKIEMIKETLFSISS